MSDGPRTRGGARHSGRLQALWRRRLRGWPAFAAWTVAFQFLWVTAGSEDTTAIGYAFVGLLVVILVARLSAAPFGAAGGFGLLLVVATLLDPLNVDALVGGAVTLGVAALAWAAALRAGDSARRRWRARPSRRAPAGPEASGRRP